MNIRAGAHYTQFLVYDFDGDGRSRTHAEDSAGHEDHDLRSGRAVAAERYVTMPERDVEAGVTHQDDYRMSNADFRDHLTELFLGWHERPEVVVGTMAGDARGGVRHRPGDARVPAVAARRARSSSILHRRVRPEPAAAATACGTSRGSSSSGPEYLTVFDGLTGGRTADGRLQAWPRRRWPAVGRLRDGDASNRATAWTVSSSGVAYLDGTQPSAVFARGYYTRSTIAAYNWNGEQLEEGWFVDSGHVPLTNPFNDGPHGRDGTDPEFGHADHAGLPLAERRRRRRRRQAGDRLRIGHGR